VTNKIAVNIFRFIVLVLLQVLIVRNINFGTYFIMLPYVLFIISLPFETPRLLILGLSFLLGISIDIFYSTPGLHASACTTMGFARYYVLKFISPREGYDVVVQPTIEDMGLEWFIKYAGVLILVHHFVFFYFEVFRFDEFFRTFLRVILSSIGTFLMVYLIQFLFYTKRFKK
jgi:hypothetical protein